MTPNKRKPFNWARLSWLLGLALFRPVIYVLAGATAGLGLLAVAVGADPSVIMAEFAADAAVEVAPLVWRLFGIWAIFTALAALFSANVGELCRLSDAGRVQLAYALLGKSDQQITLLWAGARFLRYHTVTYIHTRKDKWTAGVNPPLVYE